jgi:hypothetical protein
LLDVLDVHRSWYKAEDSLVQNRAGVDIVLIGLSKAFGPQLGRNDLVARKDSSTASH